MSRTEFDQLRDHEYDGIREYDNPLPGWWTGLFVASIIFAVAYWAFYHWGGPGLSETEAYAEDMAAYREVQAKMMAKMGKIDEKAIADMATDSAAMAEAQLAFGAKCAPCHLADGRGKIGPNLTDLHQIHGSTRADIYKTIRDGVPAKGMIAWGKQLQPAEMIKLAAYVATLRGKNVAGGKAPEGERVENWE